MAEIEINKRLCKMNIKQKLKHKILQYKKYKYIDKQYRDVCSRLDKISVWNAMNDAFDAKYMITKKIYTSSIPDSSACGLTISKPDEKSFGHQYPCFVRHVETDELAISLSLLNHEHAGMEPDKEFSCPNFKHYHVCDVANCYWLAGNIAYIEKEQRLETVEQEKASVGFEKQKLERMRTHLWNEFMGREK